MNNSCNYFVEGGKKGKELEIKVKGKKEDKNKGKKRENIKCSLKEKLVRNDYIVLVQER